MCLWLKEMYWPGSSTMFSGTVTLAQAAAAVGVDHFVLVSTDKAVRPVGTMGATKRLAELVVADLARSGASYGQPTGNGVLHGPFRQCAGIIGGRSSPGFRNRSQVAGQ